MDTNNENYNSICNICYESLGDNNTATTPCGHKFCFKCIIESLQYRNTCPCCRAILKPSKENSNNTDDANIESYEDDITLGYLDDNGLYHLPIIINSTYDFYQAMKECGHLEEIQNPHSIPTYYFHHTLLKIIYGNTIDLDKELYYEHSEFDAYESLASFTTRSVEEIAFIFRRTHLLKRMCMIRFMNFPHIYGFSIFQTEQNLPNLH